MHTKIELLDHDFTICKVSSPDAIDFRNTYTFYARTDEEISLVCETKFIPDHATDTEPGWRALRLCGILDFGLVGVLSRITGILADHKIALFAISTYNTDYIFVRQAQCEKAAALLSDNGYTILR